MIQAIAVGNRRERLGDAAVRVQELHLDWLLVEQRDYRARMNFVAAVGTIGSGDGDRDRVGSAVVIRLHVNSWESQ
jgi:hypothetical protein